MHSAGIASYGLIGDCRSAALVSTSGSIDWLCLPRFDSPSILGALLDGERGGCFSIMPAGRFDTTRRYEPGTNILETTFRTPGGRAVLRDAMSVSSEEDKHLELFASHELLREIESLDGEMELCLHYEPRPDYGRVKPRLEQRGRLGIRVEYGRGTVVLLSDMPLALSSDRSRAAARFRVRAGERRYASLLYSGEAPAVLPPLGPAARQRMERSAAWWRQWSERCIYSGPYHQQVGRSLLALKLLTYAPSGAVIAAPTTSLPEVLGGVRNWDYRYCWLRDASLTIRALVELGYDDEANAFCSWLLQSTRLSLPKLHVLYDVFGGTHVDERELPDLAGYADSRPVRVGNDAHSQLQMDVYGELIDAVARYLLKLRLRPDSETRDMLVGLGRTVCRGWRQADKGIWELRSEPRQHTHSKALCWVALDRLLAMHDAGLLLVPVDDFRAMREAIRAEIECRGYNAELNSYTQTFDGSEVDASLLLLSLYGYVDGKSPRMTGTVERILADLARGPFVYRYRLGSDALSGQEGAFGIACFWAIEALARAGHLSRAHAMFEQLLEHTNDLGLYAEEFDTQTGEPLGNFPQAFTHVGLINAALTLAELSTGRQETAAPAEVAR